MQYDTTSTAHSQAVQRAKMIFQEALQQFPYKDIEATGFTLGDLDLPDASGEIDFSEEYMFTAGTLVGHTFMAGGWIDLRTDQEDIFISATFALSKDGDWKQGRILKEDFTFCAEYDLKTKAWALWFDTL